MLNVEIKARATEKQQSEAIDWLNGFAMGPDGSTMHYKGEDRQTDTYFNVASGRLKLREGNIENCLIQYDRPDKEGPKISRYNLIFIRQGDIKDALTKALGVLAVVKKRRQIYYLSNIKIHFDELEGLGRFIEIEARDEEGTIGIAKLREQTDQLIKAFNIHEEDLVSDSYSDMVLRGV